MQAHSMYIGCLYLSHCHLLSVKALTSKPNSIGRAVALRVVQWVHRGGLGYYSTSLLRRISECVSAEGIISNNGGGSSGLIILLNSIDVDACKRVILYGVITGKE
jgi:hypothetical protein